MVTWQKHQDCHALHNDATSSFVPRHPTTSTTTHAEGEPISDHLETADSDSALLCRDSIQPRSRCFPPHLIAHTTGMATSSLMSVAAGTLSTSFVSQNVSSQVCSVSGVRLCPKLPARVLAISSGNRATIRSAYADTDVVITGAESTETLAAPIISELEFLPIPSFEECFPHSTKEIRCVFNASGPHKCISFFSQFVTFYQINGSEAFNQASLPFHASRSARWLCSRLASKHHVTWRWSHSYIVVLQGRSAWRVRH